MLLSPKNVNDLIDFLNRKYKFTDAINILLSLSGCREPFNKNESNIIESCKDKKMLPITAVDRLGYSLYNRNNRTYNFSPHTHSYSKPRILNKDENSINRFALEFNYDGTAYDRFDFNTIIDFDIINYGIKVRNACSHIINIDHEKIDYTKYGGVNEEKVSMYCYILYLFNQNLNIEELKYSDCIRKLFDILYFFNIGFNLGEDKQNTLSLQLFSVVKKDSEDNNDLKILLFIYYLLVNDIYLDGENIKNTLFDVMTKYKFSVDIFSKEEIC